MSATTISTVPELALTSAVVQELLEKHRATLIESLSKMLAAAPSASTPSATAPAGKKAKKVKKEVDPNAPPKEKRPPNSWILFAMRVEKLVRAAEESQGKTTRETRLHTIVIKQFAASLKEKKAYDEWTDDEVVEELSTWTPPEVSKQAAAKAAKAAGAPEAPESAEAPAAAAPAEGAEKPKRQWSEEAKAAAALKRAATKAAKAAAAAGGAVAAEPATAAAPAESTAKKAVVIKPKAATPAAKPVDLSFFSWTHEGKSYYTNDRGDVVTEDFEWVGRFDGTKIDEKVGEPADLGEATMRGE